MKKLLKGVLYVFLGFIALGVIASLMGEGEEETSSKDTSTGQTEEVVKEEESKKEPAKEEGKPEKKKESKNKPGISKKEFDQLKSGMSYEEVVKIVGSEGEVLSESGNEGEDLHTVMYSWEGESGWGSNANAMFQGGKLNTKAQMGLE